MGFIRYDSRVDECCCLGFLSARKALKSGSVFAGGAEIRAFTHTVGQGNTDTDTDNCIEKEATVSARHVTKTTCLLSYTCFFFTFSEDLWDFSVAGTEGAVDLEAIGIIKE